MKPIDLSKLNEKIEDVNKINTNETINEELEDGQDELAPF
jgi:hypothetical protein